MTRTIALALMLAGCASGDDGPPDPWAGHGWEYECCQGGWGYYRDECNAPRMTLCVESSNPADLAYALGCDPDPGACEWECRSTRWCFP